MNRIILILILFSTVITCSSKTLKENKELLSDIKNEISNLENKHQKCLDSGIDMLNCSKLFRSQMDSIYNVVFEEYSLSLTDKERILLLEDEKKWKKEREAFWIKEQQSTLTMLDQKEPSSDMYMILYDKDAHFVKDRIFVLIKRME